jgi:hypothetical protein
MGCQIADVALLQQIGLPEIQKYIDLSDIKMNSQQDQFQICFVIPINSERYH